MVGVPARGKSYITKKFAPYCPHADLSRLARYLNWYRPLVDIIALSLTLLSRRQHKTRIFNVGNRRRLAHKLEDDSAHATEHDARFFDPNNAEYSATRDELAMDTLEELLHWLLEENGSVGILGISFWYWCSCQTQQIPPELDGLKFSIVCRKSQISTFFSSKASVQTKRSDYSYLY